MFEAYADRTSDMAFVPLRIKCVLADSAVSTQGLHLDAILSFAVVEQETHGAMLPNQSEYVRIPLPLKTLWESIGNVPLWASTDFYSSSGTLTSDVRYWHRRGVEPHMSKKNLRLTSGAGKELRTPMPTINSPVLQADCIGNPEEIARLLSKISSVGKKRGSSGAVLRWEVEETDSFSVIDKDKKLLRTVPGGYAVDSWGAVPLDLSFVSFSPPYWHVATRGLCVLPGYSL